MKSAGILGALAMVTTGVQAYDFLEKPIEVTKVYWIDMNNEQGESRAPMDFKTNVIPKKVSELLQAGTVVKSIESVNCQAGDEGGDSSELQVLCSAEIVILAAP